MSFKIFLIVFVLFVCFERWFEIRWMQRNKIKGTVYHKWTLNFLGISYVLFLMMVVAEYILIKRDINPVAVFAGLFLWIARFFIKRWGAKTLGEYWSADIEIREGHKLIKKGPYEFVRHPAYFSNIIDVISVPLIANSYYTLFSGTVLMILFILSRIPLEEKALISKFGDEYVKYRESTYAVIPFIL